MPPLALPDPPLCDQRVLLRDWTEEDVAAIVAGFADPAVRRFSWPLTRAYTSTDAHDYLGRDRRARLAGTEVGFALVTPDAPASVLGGGLLYDVDRRVGRAAIGYWLAPHARGRGVVTHAVGLAAGWALGSLGIARLELTCAPDNVASQRVAERCGFSREARLRSHVRFPHGRRDTLVFSSLAGERR